MATIVRRFSLKTYEVRGPLYFYNPDFAVRWTPAIGKGGFLSAAASGDPSPLDSGLDGVHAARPHAQAPSEAICLRRRLPRGLVGRRQPHS